MADNQSTMRTAIERAIRNVASDTAFVCQGGKMTIENQPTIEEWKERNLRRVDIGGMSVMVLREDAMRHLEAVSQRMARMKMALHRIKRFGETDAAKLAEEGLQERE